MPPIIIGYMDGELIDNPSGDISIEYGGWEDDLCDGSYVRFDVIVTSGDRAMVNSAGFYVEVVSEGAIM